MVEDRQMDVCVCVPGCLCMCVCVVVCACVSWQSDQYEGLIAAAQYRAIVAGRWERESLTAWL